MERVLAHDVVAQDVDLGRGEGARVAAPFDPFVCLDLDKEAVEAFSADETVSSALGGYISKNLVEIKTREFEDYVSYTGLDWAASRPRITPWEIDRYLTRC